MLQKQLFIKRYSIKVPGGIVLSKGSPVKILTLEVFGHANNGWSELEFFGIEDLEMVNRLVWKSGYTTENVLSLT